MSKQGILMHLLEKSLIERLSKPSHYPGFTPEEDLELDIKIAIRKAQFNTIIELNRDNLSETIRLLHEFDPWRCSEWVRDTFGNK